MHSLVVATFRGLIGTLVFIYIVAPTFLLLFPSIHNAFIFMNFIKWPFHNFADLEGAGIKQSGRNFYLESSPGVTLGVWQILPKSLSGRGKTLDDSDFEASLSKSFQIILYLHGNGFSRMSPHRVELYNMLSENDHHVIAVDYRGYGDSSGNPTEEGVVADGLFMYDWIRSKIPAGKPVFIWGHSLGTAVGTKVAQALCRRNQCPAGLVLESPFNNLTEIIRHVPTTRLFRWLPFFDAILVRPVIEHLGIDLNTDVNIRDIHAPILILHAEEDRIVPAHLAERLYESAKQAGRDVELIMFDEKHDYGHKYVCRAPELPEIFRKFITKCVS